MNVDKPLTTFERESSVEAITSAQDVSSCEFAFGKLCEHDYHRQLRTILAYENALQRAEAEIERLKSETLDAVLQDIRTGKRLKMIGGSDVCETCNAHCIVAEEDEVTLTSAARKIALVRALCGETHHSGSDLRTLIFAALDTGENQKTGFDWDHQRFALAWESLDGVTKWQSDEQMSVKIALNWLHDLAGFGKVIECDKCQFIFGTKTNE